MMVIGQDLPGDGNPQFLLNETGLAPTPLLLEAGGAAGQPSLYEGAASPNGRSVSLPCSRNAWLGQPPRVRMLWVLR